MDPGRHPEHAHVSHAATRQRIEGDRGHATHSAGLASGYWGRLRGGFWQQTNGSGGFSRWDIMAGTADTILFYIRADGTARRVTLQDGIYSDKGPFATNFKRGWRIIAGGR